MISSKIYFDQAKDEDESAYASLLMNLEWLKILGVDKERSREREFPTVSLVTKPEEKWEDRKLE